MRHCKGDRMSNTEQASEPTMEEILSSIRKIISDDDHSASEPAPAPVAASPAPVEDVTETEQDLADGEFDRDEDDPNEDIFELTDMVDEEPVADIPDIAPMALIDPDAVDDLEFASASDGRDPEPEPEPEPEVAAEPVMPVMPVSDPEPPAPRAPSKPDRGLLSDEAGTSTSAAFGKLAETMLLNYGDAKTIEELVQEMLRPMLKMWLDDNLPPLVERLVREEIERVARRR